MFGPTLLGNMFLLVLRRTYVQDTYSSFANILWTVGIITSTIEGIFHTSSHITVLFFGKFLLRKFGETMKGGSQ